tara:strand:- start:3213 stop:4265 length:1053 start_codon:yes stop_codon:yes gene_type:complete
MSFELYKSFIDNNKNKFLFKNIDEGIEILNNLQRYNVKNILKNKCKKFGIVHILQYIKSKRIRMYIIRKCNLNFKNSNNNSILEMLCKSYKSYKTPCIIEENELIKEILENDPYINLNLYEERYCKEYILEIAVNNKNININTIKLLLNYNPKKMIFEKKIRIKISLMKKILSKKHYVLEDVINKSIKKCLSYQKNDQLKIILDYGKKNNYNFDYTLIINAIYKNYEIFKLLLKNIANINNINTCNYNTGYRTLLLHVTSFNNLDMIKDVLKYRPNLHIKNSHNQTCFDIIIKYSKYENGYYSNKALLIIKEFLNYDKTIFNPNVFNLKYVNPDREDYEYFKNFDKKDEK